MPHMPRKSCCIAGTHIARAESNLFVIWYIFWFTVARFPTCEHEFDSFWYSGDKVLVSEYICFVCFRHFMASTKKNDARLCKHSTEGTVPATVIELPSE